MESVFGMRPASDINVALDSLPVAELVDLKDVQHDNVLKHFKAVRVTRAGNDKVDYVNVLSDRYHVVNHRDAFRPVIEGLVQSGTQDFNFVTWATPKKAQIQVYTGETGYDNVSIGFTIDNSYDGTSALSFGVKMSKGVTEIEVCGYRIVCSNGMKIRVPLDQADIVGVEERGKILNLLTEHARIRHSRNAEQKLQALQYVVEAVTLLRTPVENMIKKAQKWTWVDQEHLKELVKKHVGKRIQQKVLNRVVQEPDTSLWSLYNAITYVGSHSDMRDVSREHVIDQAANLLTAELFPKK